MENLVSNVNFAGRAPGMVLHSRPSLTTELFKAAVHQPLHRSRVANTRTCRSSQTSTDVQTLQRSSVDESATSSFWDEVNGRSLVAVLPMPDQARILDASLVQPLTFPIPEELEHRRDIAPPQPERSPGLPRRFT